MKRKEEPNEQQRNPQQPSQSTNLMEEDQPPTSSISDGTNAENSQSAPEAKRSNTQRGGYRGRGGSSRGRGGSKFSLLSLLYDHNYNYPAVFLAIELISFPL